MATTTSHPSRRRILLVSAAVTVATVAVAAHLINGSLDWRSEQKPIEGGARAEGHVIKVVADHKFRSAESYRTWVEFYDAAGKRHQIVSRSGTKAPKVGDLLQVSYDPANPSLAHDLTIGHDAWKLPLWLGIGLIIAGLSFDVGAWLVLRRRRLKA